jgi:acyl-CoA thioester hydrolase
MESGLWLRYGCAAFGKEIMNKLSDVLRLRVRYSETDQMGTFYNSRALEWFECGRTELMRNLLRITSTVELQGRAKLRFDVEINQNGTGRPVVRGYTIHAFTDTRGKPIRPPAWFVALLEKV